MEEDEERRSKKKSTERRRTERQERRRKNQELARNACTLGGEESARLERRTWTQKPAAAFQRTSTLLSLRSCIHFVPMMHPSSLTVLQDYLL